LRRTPERSLRRQQSDHRLQRRRSDEHGVYGALTYNGVTRATRIAKLAPGTLIRVEVIGKLPKAFAGEPKIGDLLP
jgi:hypothetical protein